MMFNKKFFIVSGVIFSALILLPAVTHAATVNLTSGLIDYWSFDTGTVSGTTVQDKSPGQCGIGTLAGSASQTTGVVGQALTFNGSSQMMVSSSFQDNPTSFSLSVWFKTTSASGHSMIGFESDSPGLQNTDDLKQDSYDRQLYMGTDGKVHFAWGNSSNIASTNTLNNGGWHHAAVTYDGTTARLYIDGTLQSSGTGAAQNYYGRWRLGGYLSSGFTSASNGYFNGTLDEAMVYNRAINSDEVTALKNISASTASSLQVPASNPVPSHPVVETVPGYTPASFSSYGLPISSVGNSGDRWTTPISGYPQPMESPWTPSSLKSTWYDGTPSPQTCYASIMGVCLYIGGTQGVRIAQVTATPQITSPASTLAFLSGLGIFLGFDSAETNSTTVTDLSGNGGTGGITNGPLSATSDHFGQSGKAMTFNGTNQQVVFSTQYGNPQTFSISLWFKTTSASGHKLVGFEDTSSPTGADDWDHQIWVGTDGKVYFGAYFSGSHSISSTGTVTNGAWHHVVATFSSGIGKLYLDGQLQSSLSVSGQKLSFNGYWHVGGYTASGFTNATNGYFAGSVDEVMLWTRALSQADVTSIYNMTTADLASLHPNSISPVSGGVDLVSYPTSSTNPCGVPQTHWAYVQQPATLYVPKNTQVDFAYACQPSQDYFWKSDQNGSFSYDGTATQQRIFRFADRVKVNGGSASATLYGGSSQSVSDTTTYTVECGGYVPEEGVKPGLRPLFQVDSAVPYLVDDFNMVPDSNDYRTGYGDLRPDTLPRNVGLPQFYKANGSTLPTWVPNLQLPNDGTLFQKSCGTYCYWPWTWLYYNVANPSYYHAPASVTVQVCADNQIVLNNVCTACPTGQYASGNACVSTKQPTVAINAGAGNGVGVAGTTGVPVTITATYSPASGDTLSASAINNDSTATSVSCATVTGTPSGTNKANCWTLPDTKKVYTFTPPAPGTYTFSPQVKTSKYPNYSSYGKTVTVTVPCPTGSSGASCNVCASGYGWNGTSCQACTASQHTDMDTSSLTYNQCVLNTQSCYVFTDGVQSGTGTKTWNGSSWGACVASSCDDGYRLSGGACVAGDVPELPTFPAPTTVPGPGDSTFTASRVRSGNASTLSWNIKNMADGITCSISPTPASGTNAGVLDWAGAGSPATYTGTAQTAPVTAPTIFTLTCSNGEGGEGSVSASATVSLIPSFQEI